MPWWRRPGVQEYHGDSLEWALDLQSLVLVGLMGWPEMPSMVCPDAQTVLEDFYHAHLHLPLKNGTNVGKYSIDPTNLSQMLVNIPAPWSIWDGYWWILHTPNRTKRCFCGIKTNIYMISWYEHLTISVQCVHCISLYITIFYIIIIYTYIYTHTNNEAPRWGCSQATTGRPAFPPGSKPCWTWCFTYWRWWFSRRYITRRYNMLKHWQYNRYIYII